MQSYDLTLAAEEDLRDIWRYTYETWGFEQAETYFDRIEACCEAVGDRRTRAKTFDRLPDGVRIHRCERHYIGEWAKPGGLRVLKAASTISETLVWANAAG